MTTQSDIEKALAKAKNLRCKRCITGLVMCNLYNDYSCINCGFVLYTSNTPSIIIANNPQIAQAPRREYRVNFYLGLDLDEDSE